MQPNNTYTSTPDSGAETAASPSTAPAKPQSTKMPSALSVGVIVIYILVLGLTTFGVYSTQNTKLEQAKKDLAAEQAKNKLPNEASNVDKTKYQAVFLNSGQIYFAKVRDLNSQFVTIDNIFYLRTGGNTQSIQAGEPTSDMSLVKLGCELHGPADKMVINRSQVNFWENLKDDGKVVQAINTYKKIHPDGQSC